MPRLPCRLRKLRSELAEGAEGGIEDCGFLADDSFAGKLAKAGAVGRLHAFLSAEIDEGRIEQLQAEAFLDGDDLLKQRVDRAAAGIHRLVESDDDEAIVQDFRARGQRHVVRRPGAEKTVHGVADVANLVGRELAIGAEDPHARRVGEMAEHLCVNSLKSRAGRRQSQRITPIDVR